MQGCKVEDNNLGTKQGAGARQRGAGWNRISGNKVANRIVTHQGKGGAALNSHLMMNACVADYYSLLSSQRHLLVDTGTACSKQPRAVQCHQQVNSILTYPPLKEQPLDAA